MQVFERHCAVHQLLLLQQQHKQPPLHVPEQVAGAIGVNPVVTDDGALLQTGGGHKHIVKMTQTVEEQREEV